MSPDVVRNRLRAVGTLCGLAAPGVGLGTVLLATLLAPWFSWTGNALSDLGHPSRATAPLFNGGMALAGLLALAFAGRLWIDAEGWVRRGALIVLAASFASLVGVGAYPETTDLHFTVSVAFFVSLTYGLWLYGSADALAGTPERGVATIWLGVANVTGWVLYATFEPFEGVAIPEAVGGVALVAWAVPTALRLRRSQ
ncbi:MAG TPA: DUF998 domain-containing protein [Natrialbaceae archaeon]|nr:DUF998 domain-containing protein [Natrialbaceae archaeon]